MRLLTWNVAGRVRRRPEQVRRVLGLQPDVVALQEVTPTTVRQWSADLARAGFHVATTADRARPEGRRLLGVLIASRAPLRPRPLRDLAWPERALAVTTSGIGLFNFHSPISPSPGLAKVRMHERLHRLLAAGRGPRVLCGDLNTPRRETVEGEVVTFARDSKARLRPERGERWDRAELALIRGLEGRGWRDAFRSLHGYGPRDRSWTWPNGGGYRLDHVIVSREVEVIRCEYVHQWREAGCSDHSALLAEVREAPSRPAIADR